MADVSLDWRGVERAWRIAGYEEMWLLFRCAERGEQVLLAVAQCVETANDAAEQAGWAGEVFGSIAAESAAGLVLYLSVTGLEEAVRGWLTKLAADLGSRGLTGTLTNASESSLPLWLNMGQGPIMPAAFVAYTNLEYAPWTGGGYGKAWNVDADLTREVCRAATSWGQFTGATTYVSQGLFRFRTNNPDVQDIVANGVIREDMAGVTYVHTSSRRASNFELDVNGTATYGLIHNQASWQERLERLTSILTAFPAQTDLAFLRHNNGLPMFWTAIMSSLAHRLPTFDDYLRRRMLYRHYVPDAHGIQLLTGSHVDKAHDLTNWSIQPLTEDRYLVTTTNPEAWFAESTINDEVVTQARADFGAMIVTPETLDEGLIQGR